MLERRKSLPFALYGKFGKFWHWSNALLLCRANIRQAVGEENQRASSGRDANGSAPKRLSAETNSHEDTTHEPAFARSRDTLRVPLESVSRSTVDSSGMAAGEILEAAVNVNEGQTVGTKTSKAAHEKASKRQANAEDFPEDQILVDDW